MKRAFSNIQPEVISGLSKPRVLILQQGKSFEDANIDQVLFLQWSSYC